MPWYPAGGDSTPQPFPFTLADVAERMEQQEAKMSHTTARVEKLPSCSFRHNKPVDAKYDGKTKGGPWAYMCQLHFDEQGVGLGLGKGQELYVEQPSDGVFGPGQDGPEGKG